MVGLEFVCAVADNEGTVYFQIGFGRTDVPDGCPFVSRSIISFARGVSSDSLNVSWCRCCGGVRLT